MGKRIFLHMEAQTSQVPSFDPLNPLLGSQMLEQMLFDIFYTGEKSDLEKLKDLLMLPRERGRVT